MIKDPAILKELVALKELPTLPQVTADVLAVLASERSSADDVASILSKDQALCSKVLKIANSAFFAQSRRISTAEDAIVLLGFDSIAQLMLATAVFKSFRPMQPQVKFDLYGFWRHSIATANAGKIIAEAAEKASEATKLYTAGLLHDIGKLVLVTYFPDRYVPVFRRAESGTLSMYEAEMAELEFSHCQVSEWLCNRWSFPEKLVEAISRHHERVSSTNPEPETQIVRLANIVCNRMKLGASGNTKPYPLTPEEYMALGLDESDLAKIEDRLKKKDREIEVILRTIS